MKIEKPFQPGLSLSKFQEISQRATTAKAETAPLMQHISEWRLTGGVATEMAQSAILNTSNKFLTPKSPKRTILLCTPKMQCPSRHCFEHIRNRIALFDELYA